jgi:hypothetical protein
MAQRSRMLINSWVNEMVAKDFPCQICGHQAIQHYVNIADGQGVCIGCQVASGFIQINEQFHNFEGDNLKYMELQIKRQELRNE